MHPSAAQGAPSQHSSTGQSAPSPTCKSLNGLQPLQVLAQAGAVLPLGRMQVVELALRLAAGQPLGRHREQVAQLLEGKVPRSVGRGM